MTTRYENVAHVWLDGSTIGMYKLKALTLEKSWELFDKKTFQSCGRSCPSSLNDLGHKIVKKCGGFPPAIISIGRLLSTKEDDVIEWKKVSHGLGFYLATNRHLLDIYKIFLQIYYDLPFYLKPCFLYLGLFPKGHPISQMKVIRLWIAEGFIRERKENLSLEEVAEEYIRELINMSIIDVRSTDVCGKVRSIGLVSDFLYEIILTKLDELSYCKIISKKDYGGNESCRRLSIHKNRNSIAAEFLKNITKVKSSIRTLLVLDLEPEILANVLNKALFKSIYLLKVLDLFNAPIDHIPKEIGKLLNLHYLNLRCTRVSALPSSIGKLENLQTLDLKHW
ncbi:hypothetical protein RND81_02G240000 [Saponaria officinalis]|uniref:NB-ARC domain-containing protein n=1 Tax=Saponaria officinalis TaxID=3572 RepID=A0AAW1MXH7_SAPOF